MGRRLASFVYEGVLLFGVLMFAGLVYGVSTQQRHALTGSAGLRVFLFFVLGAYFILFWTRTGQTLAMQTWRMKLVSIETTGDDRVTVQQAVKRYVMAVIGISFFGIGLWWALFDRDRQFLHDRLAHTRIVQHSNQP